ncbi:MULTISPECIES: gamma-glutamyl-gamma-aminobutyrate hydrolase family protein [unclassified Streptomyces]|uniref:gamma-glutamyl-gamma-aminobutyrate hydrolase family protein n=1 Tax=unclassified Streptomyces TaxID=2593676 RepID=UPI002254BD29|nr:MULTISPECIES: gamma-glutamyl-gamma-aminobutyrate hydrolase family protein [unclassified Streptomyces]MCX4527159.1 gamma-glutamyl-gamma-aminobutyrate hydrolase family protein [Streptomyces sp. NBC_01551]MCX4542265.1 gamma-glutamyl-gamma-aminobutyrate hydrolase family protein [Streptomyces sp. NBC_01565]
MNSAVNDPAGAGRPVIGICARTAPVTLQGSDMVVSLALQSHVAFLAEAGCTPVLLPLLPGVEHLVGALDGLLVPGGPDLDPALYGQAAHPVTRAMTPDADRAELALVRAALDAKVPVLAICRGMQLLNVLHGGTLHQHLPEVTGGDGHRPNTPSFTLGHHRLKLRPDSRIAGVLDEDEPETACHHHQAVARLGDGLTATGWAEDGTVEAVEVTDHPFAIGVQWESGQTADKRLHHALAQAAGCPKSS